MSAYYNKNGITNILSMGEISKKPRVAMDTVKRKFIKVYLNCNNLFKFYKCGAGIYYHDTNYATQSRRQLETNKVSFLSTVRDNERFYNTRELKAAIDSRELQANIARPSSADFKYYIKKGHILNFPHAEDYVDIGEAVYGPLEPILQGKIIKRKQRNGINAPRISITYAFVKFHPTDELDMNYFHVNGVTFLFNKFKNHQRNSGSERK